MKSLKPKKSPEHDTSGRPAEPKAPRTKKIKMTETVYTVLVVLIFVSAAAAISGLIFGRFLKTEKYWCGFGLIFRVIGWICSGDRIRVILCQILMDVCIFSPVYVAGGLGYYIGAGVYYEGIDPHRYFLHFLKIFLAAAVLSVLFCYGGFLLSLPFSVIAYGHSDMLFFTLFAVGIMEGAIVTASRYIVESIA